jgi:hypothetical protein
VHSASDCEAEEESEPLVRLRRVLALYSLAWGPAAIAGVVVVIRAGTAPILCYVILGALLVALAVRLTASQTRDWAAPGTVVEVVPASLKAVAGASIQAFLSGLLALLVLVTADVEGIEWIFILVVALAALMAVSRFCISWVRLVRLEREYHMEVYVHPSRRLEYGRFGDVVRKAAGP